MKKIIIFLLFSSQISLAQEKQMIVDIRRKVAKAIVQNIDRELLGKTPTNFVYLFSVTLSFDEDGKIDTVYFPKKIPEDVNKVMKLNSALVKRIKEQHSVYEIYAGKLVFIMIFYNSLLDDKIDYRSRFLESYENLLPSVLGSSNKQLMILDPLIESFSQTIKKQVQ